MTVDAIFSQALAKTAPTERIAYLDEVCADDVTLRLRVETLLESHEEAGDFLRKPAIHFAAEALADLPHVGEKKGEGQAGNPEQGLLELLTPSDKPDSLGRLGHYEVLEVIGRGGMGIVLRAFDEKLLRMVAVKVLAAQIAVSATARKRFAREAQAAAAVSHDHVVTIHAVEETNGLPYLVMQYVAGMSLQDRLDRDGHLQLHEILRIGMQTATGLAAAHAQGLVHRDVKPSNILLENGVERVKITDFGLARAMSDASLSQSGAVAGTPSYMSPEQARGDALDHRSDLFSLGSVLYTMCTGHPPFRAANSMAVLKRVCEEFPTPIRETNPELPDWLCAIVEGLHAKDPADRYQSANEVAKVLGRHLAHVQHPSVMSLPAVPKPSVSSRSRRGRWWAVAAAVLVALVASLGMTEAAGVTKVRATVIRIFTPDGTLVVEVDDPTVKVTIEGDGDLVITGAGAQEIRLRPGAYKVQATKDGKPVKIDRDLITISRGDTQVVRVRLEADTTPAAVAPRAEPGDPRLLAELAGYDATLKENPNDPATLLRRGRVLLQLKRFDAAATALSRVLMTTSDPTERRSALFNRALAHAERGHLQGTIEDYEEWLRDGDDAAWVYGRLATCYTFGPEKLRNPKRALEHAETAIQKRGAHAGYHTLHGVCLYRVGRHREAIETLERAYGDKGKDKGDRSAMNRFFAAMSYQRLGEPAKAQASYALALKLPQSPSHPGTEGIERMRAEAEAALKVPAKK